MSKNYILEPSYKKIVDFVLTEINNRSYFKVKSIAKWYMTNELGLSEYTMCGALPYSIGNKVGKILRELVSLNIIEKDGRTRYKNLNRGNIRKAVDEQIDKNYHIIKLKK